MPKKNPVGFSDLVKPTCKIEELLDEVTIFESYTVAKGRYGDFAKVEVLRQGDMEQQTLLTGAMVVIDRLRAAENHRMLPLAGVVIKVPGQWEYFDIVSPDDVEAQAGGAKAAAEAKRDADSKS